MAFYTSRSPHSSRKPRYRYCRYPYALAAHSCRSRRTPLPPAGTARRAACVCFGKNHAAREWMAARQRRWRFSRVRPEKPCGMGRQGRGTGGACMIYPESPKTGFSRCAQSPRRESSYPLKKKTVPSACDSVDYFAANTSKSNVSRSTPLTISVIE